MTEPKPFVDIRNAQKSYGALEVLKDISLQVARGEIVAIIGPSGSGKSTLLRAINDLGPADGGARCGWKTRRSTRSCRTANTRSTSTRCGRTSAWCSSTSTCSPISLGARERDACAEAREAPVRGRGRGTGARAAGKGGADRPDRLLPYPRACRAVRNSAWPLPARLAMKPKVMLFDEATSALGPRTGRGGEPW